MFSLAVERCQAVLRAPSLASLVELERGSKNLDIKTGMFHLAIGKLSCSVKTRKAIEVHSTSMVNLDQHHVPRMKGASR